MSQREDSWVPGNVLVKFIDEGRTGLVATDQLLNLPESFSAIPPQAVEFIVCRVKPTDGEMEWNPKVSLVYFLCFVDLYNICNPEPLQNWGFFKFKALHLGLSFMPRVQST